MTQFTVGQPLYYGNMRVTAAVTESDDYGWVVVKFGGGRYGFVPATDLTPAPKEYEQGGVVFVEDGPPRIVHPNEWARSSFGLIFCATDNTYLEYQPVKPVRLVGEKQ